MADLRSTILELVDESKKSDGELQTAKRTVPFISREMLLYKLIQMIDQTIEKDKKIIALRNVCKIYCILCENNDNFRIWCAWLMNETKNTTSCTKNTVNLKRYKFSLRKSYDFAQ